MPAAHDRERIVEEHRGGSAPAILVGLGLVALLAWLAVPPAAGAQPAARIYRVGFMAGGTATASAGTKEAVPAARRFAVLSNPANPGHTRAVEELAAAFAAMARDHGDARLVVSDSLFGSHVARLAALAARSRLPSMHGARSNVSEGGLLFYAPDLVRQPRQAAAYADRILKGARPADLPVEQPARFELIVNLETAKALGLTIPQSLLARADHVIH